MGEGFLILLALFAVLAVLALPVLVIVLFVQLSGVRERLSLLEARVARQSGREGPAISAEPGASPRPAAPLAAAVPPQRPVTQVSSDAAGPWNPAATPDPDAHPPGDPPPAPGPAALAANDQNRPLVLRADRFAALFDWLRENWVYAVAAISLALAGVFFVQYGIEAGLLPPPLRVAAGVAFGLALIAGGEWLRRRFGDGAESATAYLPSVFSGAGLVAVFAAVTAGRLMYGLYGPEATFAALLLTAAGAIVLGWLHGPLLVAIGLIGAAAAPFLVGGTDGAAPWLYGHYLLIAAAGLAVDAWRRWAWVSVLALVLAHLGLGAMMAAGAGLSGWMVALALLVPLAIIIPERRLMPRHDGPAVSLALWRRDGVWPGFAVRLAAGNTLAAVGQFLLIAPEGTEGMLAFVLLAGLALLLLLWLTEAPGLDDLAALPAAVFLIQLMINTRMIYDWFIAAESLRAPETAGPITVTLLLGLAALISAAAAWRSLRNGTLAHAMMAILVAPVAAGILEMLWEPAPVIGVYPWALHVMAVAAGMVGLAVAFARADGQPGRRTAWATLAALSLIALSLFILTSAAALTLALAVLLVAAAALDRRFALPEMGWFIQLGAAVLSWRLVVDPGLVWADSAPIPAVLLSYLGVAAACLAGLRLLPAGRLLPRSVLESLGLAAPALLVNVLLLRYLSGHPDSNDVWSPDYNTTHWGMMLNALPWLVLAATQLWRAAVSEGFARKLRIGLACGAALLAGWALALGVTAFNPLWAWSGDLGGRVLGPPILDTLALAYALPGVLLVLLPPRLLVLPRKLARAVQLIGVAFLVLYVVTEIRRLWHGPWINGDEVLQGELYSYTLAMLVTGAALLWQAIAKRSLTLQRVAMAVIALTVAKVFLWDASGLTGLVRVLSFAGLGLSLAALAWLNRWARQSMTTEQGDSGPPTDTP